MTPEDNLEQLENRICTSEEIMRRLQTIVYNVKGLSFDDLYAAQAAFMMCGFSFFEALYFICGPEIRNCSLISFKTKKIIWNILSKRRGDDLKETWENKLEKIIDSLDEKILMYQLQSDSKRFKKIIDEIEKKRKANCNGK